MWEIYRGGAPYVRVRVMSTYTHSESARVRVSRVSDYPCHIYYRGYDASRLSNWTDHSLHNFSLFSI